VPTNPKDRAYLLRILKPWFVSHHEKSEEAAQVRRLEAVLNAAGPMLPGKVSLDGATRRLVPRRRAFALGLIGLQLIVKLHAAEITTSLIVKHQDGEPKRISPSELARRLHKASTSSKLDIVALGVTKYDPPRATMPEQIRDLLIAAIEREGVDPMFDDAEQQLDADLEVIRWNQNAEANQRVRRALAAIVVPKSVGGRPRKWPAEFWPMLNDLWTYVLGRQGGITVDPDGMASGPLITFADACLRLVGFEREYGVVRTDAIFMMLRRGTTGPRNDRL
jgi:hypothetical protein